MLFLDNIATLNDLWIIGDKALQDIFYVLPALRCEARVAKKSPPYLYDQFNISALVMNNRSTKLSNVLARFIDCFIEGLNKNRLPRIKVIYPDGDLVQGLTLYNRPGISNEIGKIVHWLSKSFEQLIERKKEEIFLIRSGALAHNEPKTIWVKMLAKPNMCPEDKILMQKFNDILEEMLVSRKCNYIMDVQQGDIASMFDHGHNLTNDGKILIWKRFDEMIKQFDHQEISLSPRPVVSDSRNSSQLVAITEKRRLPTPPPLPVRRQESSSSRTKIRIDEYRS